MDAPKRDLSVCDLDWVTELLAVGGCPAAGSAEALAKRFGIRRVVDLRAEASGDGSHLTLHGIEFLFLPTDDMSAIDARDIDEGVEWVNEGLDRGAKTLVHCQHGIGRSALLACCVLVSRGATPLAALSAAKAKRAKICPSPAQLHALLDWSARWARRRGRPPQSDTWEQLAAVAYHGMKRR